MLEGLLFRLLTRLELNSENCVGLARGHPKELIERQERLDFIVVGGRGVRQILCLASGALLQIVVVIKEFRRRIMGEIERDVGSHAVSLDVGEKLRDPSHLSFQASG